MSQILTLFTTPVIYLAFDRLTRRFAPPPAERSAGREADVNVSALFIDRPVATTLLAVAIFLSGVLAWFHLPVAPLPNITFPVVVVQATMAGASPEIMAATVAEPLERRLATISGVTQLTSTSYVGVATIVAQFDVEPRHQRRLARRPGGDPGDARRPADDACAAIRRGGSSTRPIRRS